MTIPTHIERIGTLQPWVATIGGLSRVFSPTARVEVLSAETATSDPLDVDCIVCWGAKGDFVEHSRSIAGSQGIPFYFMEDGFVRSLGLGLKDKRSFSFIKDDVGLHYLPQHPSHLENLINQPGWFDERMHERAQALIRRMVAARVTKYNHAPIVSYPFRTNTRRVLVCDQRYKDGSVTLAGYSDDVFERMVAAALRDNPDAEVWAKVHPDAITGGKGSYIARLPDQLKASLHIISDDINPLSLLEDFEDVYVVSSQLGFEALMLGKRVHCFGLPFYAGWGLTVDDLPIDRRGQASLELVFAAAYLKYSDLSRDAIARVFPRSLHPGRAGQSVRQTQR